MVYLKLSSIERGFYGLLNTTSQRKALFGQNMLNWKKMSKKERGIV